MLYYTGMRCPVLGEVLNITGLEERVLSRIEQSPVHELTFEVE